MISQNIKNREFKNFLITDKNNTKKQATLIKALRYNKTAKAKIFKNNLHESTELFKIHNLQWPYLQPIETFRVEFY